MTKTFYEKPYFKYYESIPDVIAQYWIAINTEQTNSCGSYYRRFEICKSRPSEFSETIQETFRSQYAYNETPYNSLHEAVSDLKKLYTESIKEPNSYSHRKRKVFSYLPNLCEHCSANLEEFSDHEKMSHFETHVRQLINEINKNGFDADLYSILSHPDHYEDIKIKITLNNSVNIIESTAASVKNWLEEQGIRHA